VIPLLASLERDRPAAALNKTCVRGDVTCSPETLYPRHSLRSHGARRDTMTLASSIMANARKTHKNAIGPPSPRLRSAKMAKTAPPRQRRGRLQPLLPGRYASCIETSCIKESYLLIHLHKRGNLYR
jgi:hypothetical protein